MKQRIKAVSCKTRQKKTQSDQQNEKKKSLKRNEDSLRKHQDNKKCINICIIGIAEGEKGEQGLGNLFEKIMTENFPNLVKETVMQVQEAQKFSIKMNPKRPTLRHITIKMAKFEDKERIVKAARGKQ